MQIIIIGAISEIHNIAKDLFLQSTCKMNELREVSLARNYEMALHNREKQLLVPWYMVSKKTHANALNSNLSGVARHCL